MFRALSTKFVQRFDYQHNFGHIQIFILLSSEIMQFFYSFLIYIVSGVALAANLRANSGQTSLLSDNDNLPLHPDKDIGAKLLQKIREANSNGAKMNGISYRKLAVQLVSQDDSHGFWMSQSRGSSDCTGEVNNESGTRLGICHYESSTSSHYISCESFNGKTSQIINTFDSPDCSGNRRSFATSVELDTCCFIPQFIPYYGFAMQHTFCSPDLTPFTAAKPGLMFSYHSDPKCHTESVQYYAQVPIGSCKMYVTEGDEAGVASSFGYMKLTGCAGAGRVNMRFYADAQCTRATHTGTIDLTLDPLYNTCQLDATMGGDGLWGKATCHK